MWTLKLTLPSGVRIVPGRSFRIPAAAIAAQAMPSKTPVETRRGGERAKIGEVSVQPSTIVAGSETRTARQTDVVAVT